MTIAWCPCKSFFRSNRLLLLKLVSQPPQLCLHYLWRRERKHFVLSHEKLSEENISTSAPFRCWIAWKTLFTFVLILLWSESIRSLVVLKYCNCSLVLMISLATAWKFSSSSLERELPSSVIVNWQTKEIKSQAFDWIIERISSVPCSVKSFPTRRINFHEIVSRFVISFIYRNCVATTIVLLTQ